MKYNQTIIQVANRANHLDAVPLGKISFLLDLEVADREFHLDFDRWLHADYFNFIHDVIGIQNNIDRQKGTMINYFVPRFAKKGIK